MKSICLYHQDNDGVCSAAIIDSVFDNCEFIPINYGISVPLHKISAGDQVFVVDFSLEAKDWQKLLQITDNVTWIDHHESAIKKSEDVKWKGKSINELLKGIRRLDRSGCWLTWEYFYKDKTPPLAVQWIDAYDRWVHNDDLKILNFKEGVEFQLSYPVRS